MYHLSNKLLEKILDVMLLPWPYTAFCGFMLACLIETLYDVGCVYSAEVTLNLNTD